MKRHLRILALLSVSLATTSLYGASHGDHGWESLFNGKTLQGWAVTQGYANYYVEDGAILGRTAEGSPNTFLISYNTYDDFELKFEVKVDDGLNSGVMIRSNTRNFGSRRLFRTAGRDRVQPRSIWVCLRRRPQHRLDFRRTREWCQSRTHEKRTMNDFHIIAKGDTITTYINGNLITEKKLPRTIHRENPSGSSVCRSTVYEPVPVPMKCAGATSRSRSFSPTFHRLKEDERVFPAQAFSLGLFE